VKEKRRAEPNGERQREGPRPMQGRGRRPWAYGGLGPFSKPSKLYTTKRNLDLGLRCLIKISI
jgi:hypothetical protein